MFYFAMKGTANQEPRLEPPSSPVQDKQQQEEWRLLAWRVGNMWRAVVWLQGSARKRSDVKLLWASADEARGLADPGKLRREKMSQ